MKILIVDDEKISRKILVSRMTPFGFMCGRQQRERGFGCHGDGCGRKSPL